MAYAERGYRMLIKQAIKGLAAAAGYDAIEKWRMPFLPIATKIATLLDYFSVINVLDIGANVGQYRDFLRNEVGFVGQIYSFEADPDLSAMLMKRARLEDKNWRIFPVGLGRVPERRVLNRMTSTPFNSFLDPIGSLPEAVTRDNTIVETCPVEICRLDDFVGELGNLRRTFVKIDTQGFDLEVLGGGRNVIQHVPVLQTEISFRPIYKNMPTFTDSIAAFQQEGFVVSDLFLVFADKDFSAFEFDCIMLRQGVERP
jgi:FkbM family methyltransferase